MRVLFVTWDGPGPNYHESLFLPIFARSRRPDDEIHLLQYVWDAEERTASVRSAADRFGMPYTAQSVWRTPQAAAMTAMIAKGALDLARYIRRHRIEVLMPRSLIPAAMALLALRFLPRVQMLFDADGLMADERADFGGWSRQGRPYRLLRSIEAAAVRRADVVITRTKRAMRILLERAELDTAEKMIVVSNGKDAEAFHPGSAVERSDTRRELGLSDETPLLVYAGSLGPHYHPARMITFAARVRETRQDAHLLILTGSPAVAHEAARVGGLNRSGYTVQHVPPEEVPRYLAASDLGLAFRTASLSQQAVAPIKAGEYLLCGLPILSTSGIGDLDEQLDATTGRLLDRLDNASIKEAAAWFREEVLPARERFRAKCRERGLKHFSLEKTAEQYREAFDLLHAKAPA